MARGFNEQEKQLIRNSLIEQGRILFGRFGFQKTSIQELTEKVGIAQGTFYRFFKSKEELYFTILEIEEDKLREKFLHLQIAADMPPKELFKQILRKMIHAIETNPFIQELYVGNNMKEVVRGLPSELLEKHFMHDSEALIPLIEKWRTLGLKVKEDPTVIAGVLRSLFLLTLHEKEIGQAVYVETIELFIHLIAEGLIEEDKNASSH